MNSPSPSPTSWLDELFHNVTGVASDTTSALSALESIGAALVDPHTYVRIFMVVFGFFLVMGAFHYA